LSLKNAIDNHETMIKIPDEYQNYDDSAPTVSIDVSIDYEQEVYVFIGNLLSDKILRKLAL